MRKTNSTISSASAILLVLMLTGCASNTVKLQSADDRQLPALPEQARASKVPTPSACSPSCLSALTAERKKSQDMLTASGLLVSPASAATTQ